MEQESEIKYWSQARKNLFRFIFVYVLLFINSFSFPHSFIPDIGKYTAPFFEALVKWFADSVLKLKYAYTSNLISDSTGMYLHAFLFIFISALICLIWSLLDRKRKNYEKLLYWFRVVICYYLAMQLFTYGFSKLFKWQFYLPEPNTLFTTVGNTPRDLLYWSTMGISRPYTMFMGCAELITALLLLFRRTRLAGALLAIAILINVVMVNFCFDISVKLYSCFLLMLSIIIIIPDAKRLFSFLLANKFVENKLWKPDYNIRNSKVIYIVCKALIICLIITDSLAMYFTSNNFNDDKAERPLLHGAYEVDLFVKNQDTLAPLLTDTFRWKRIFVHRKGYLIIQKMNDEMEDHKLEYDAIAKQLIIENPADSISSELFYFTPNDSILILRGKLREDTIEIKTKKIDLKKLSALQNEFNWTIDY